MELIIINHQQVRMTMMTLRR